MIKELQAQLDGAKNIFFGVLKGIDGSVDIKLPKYVYHYTSWDSFYSMVETNSVRSHTISNFDDGLERRLSFEIENRIEGTISDNQTGNSFNFANVINEELSRDHVFIQSNTTTNHNKYLWENYGDRGSGVCLRFSTDCYIKFINDALPDFDLLPSYLNTNDWKIAEGLKIGKKKEIDELVALKAKKEGLSPNEKERLLKLEKKYKKADYLTGKNSLPSNAFTEKGIDVTRIHILWDEYFESNREKNKSIFKGPHLLIKEVVGKNSIPIAFRNDDLSFKHDIIGIHAPKNQIDDLLEIEKRIRNNRTYLFYVAGFSGRYMIGRATAILKKDVESLPYPEDEKELQLSEIEQILVDDVLDYMLDFRKKGENSVAEKPVNDHQLQQFSEIYCRVLNSVYKEFQPYKPLKTDSFICFPFYYKDKPQIRTGSMDELEADLYELIQNNTTTNSRIVRMLRIYEKNTIYLIKPKQTRYWLRSTAIRDADDTFTDLVVQGY